MIKLTSCILLVTLGALNLGLVVVLLLLLVVS
jgi:uncharacterized membrane protein YuzA (DUF378 family)